MASNQQNFISPEKYIKTKARALKIGKCLINDNWQESGMANILIIRQHTGGNSTCGVYLVDLFALGLKDSFYFFNLKPEEFEHKFIETGLFNLEIDYELAHNIIWGGIAFASEYGLKPDKSFDITEYILEEDTEDIPLIDIEFGQEGKPFIMLKDGDFKSDKAFKHLSSTLNLDEFNFVKEVF